MTEVLSVFTVSLPAALRPMICWKRVMLLLIMVRGIHLTSRLVPGGTHSEASWEKQLPFVFHTLMYELD